MAPTARATQWLLLLCLACSYARPGPTTASSEIREDSLSRERLIGAWRLVGIDYRGPHGSSVDPFYQKDSTGLLIYDASGWMSVHIAGPNRRAWEVPASRSVSADAADAPLKAAAFDSYYSYFGTWNFDPGTSVVTHRVSSALIPAESGLSYAQSVSLENGRLILTTRTGSKGAEITRRKIWQRESELRLQ